jgi:uncharacterized protein (DUF952 family)
MVISDREADQAAKELKLNKSLYKVLPAVIWRSAQAEGLFRGAGIDLEDGFIHLSSADQVVETVTKHFADQDGLLLVTIDAEKLGPALRWEPSRGGELFPHVYDVIPMDAVQKVDPLPLGDDGTHRFPF